jgi:hypothetical protein
LIILKALLICENLLDAIKRKEIVQGRVHSVFNSACNIETEHEFITFLSSGKNMSPMSVLIDNQGQVNFRNLKITQDLKFIFDVNVIYNIEKSIFIRLDNVQTWFPGVLINSSNCIEKSLLENIKVFEIGLGEYGKFNGIGPLINLLFYEFPDLLLKHFPVYSYDKTFEFIKYRFLNFIKNLLNGDTEGIAEKAECIIGFGPGLTPGMDDFISGIMISFIYFGNYYNLNVSHIYKLNKKIISLSLNKTTKVSSQMLKHSAIGESNEAVRELLNSLINYPDKESIILALLNTISYGETSGTDTALGVYIGCKILTNIKYRRVYLNESLCRY